jgi:hypothetical protein
MKAINGEIERFEVNGHLVVLVHDEEPVNTRDTKYFENAGILATWHRHEQFGERQIQPMTKEELIAELEASDEKVLAIRPLWLYSHSGYSISAAETNPFTCRWDSGQVGWAYVTEESAKKTGHELGGTPESLREKFEAVLVDEVENLNHCMAGRVYGYRIFADANCDPNEEDDIEAVWQFIGDIGFCRDQATEAAKGL